MTGEYLLLTDLSSVTTSKVTHELKASQNLYLPQAAERLMWKSWPYHCEDDALNVRRGNLGPEW